MSKAQFGEFAAYTTPGGIRFQKGSRLTSEREIPTEVVAYLKEKLSGERGHVEAPKKFPMPSEEEKARLRAESLQVKPELQLTAEEEVARSLTGIPDNETPLEEPLEPDDFPEDPRLTEPAMPSVDSNFLETVSIHTADLEDIAQALYERFGIYTVYLRKLPENDEINPLTGVAFTKYHLGIAYQAAIYAENQGFLEKDPVFQRKQMESGRQASAKFAVDPVPRTLGESRQANNFNFRTSVKGTQTIPTTRIEHVTGEDGEIHAVQVRIPADQLGNQNPNGVTHRFDSEEDEQIVEPPIFGARPIIRPNW